MMSINGATIHPIPDMSTLNQVVPSRWTFTTWPPDEHTNVAPITCTTAIFCYLQYVPYHRYPPLPLRMPSVCFYITVLSHPIPVLHNGATIIAIYSWE